MAEFTGASLNEKLPSFLHIVCNICNFPSHRATPNNPRTCGPSVAPGCPSCPSAL